VADAFSLADDVTHDLCGWANILYERARLTSIEATVFGITFEPVKRWGSRVTNHLDRLSGNVYSPDDGILSRTLTGWGTTRVFPLRNGPFA
jgi:hypothetical protein